MFHSLPAETVFEAQARTRRWTGTLFALLLGLYLLFTNLMFLSIGFFYFLFMYGRPQGRHAPPVPDPGPFLEDPILWWLVTWASLAAVLVAIFHFHNVRNKPLSQMLASIGAQDPDPKDVLHERLLRIVQEMGLAVGIPDLRAVVLPMKSCNAFSIQDGQGKGAIGVTEGLLARLGKDQLSAVVAHEAAHLAHGDSRLMTTLCFLNSFFYKLGGLEYLQEGNKRMRFALDDLSRERPGDQTLGETLVPLIFLFFHLVSYGMFFMLAILGYTLTQGLVLRISRKRELWADTDAVAISKDPMALAEALERISRRIRGDLPDVFAPLFILDGSFSSKGTHPPLEERLAQLLKWAKSDLRTLEEKVDLEKGRPDEGPDELKEVFWAYLGGQWVPCSSKSALEVGLTPITWVCRRDTQEVLPASQLPELYPLFHPGAVGSMTGHLCPRCKVPLLKVELEGLGVEQCSFCRDYLVSRAVFEKIVLRGRTGPRDVDRVKRYLRAKKAKGVGHAEQFQCPACGKAMRREFFMMSKLVLDRCTQEDCGAVWCEDGELKMLQAYVEYSFARVGN